jgi:predicted nucleic acid-binding protein
MILVADSSALVALSVCDSLTLLDQLFKEVIVPEAVFLEVVKGDKPEANVLKKYLQEKVRKVDMRSFIYLDGNADAGETEAMLLYKQELADKLLIDDRRGRRIAKINGINTIGSLGILLSAKQAGLISKIKPQIENIAASRVYLTQSLIEMVLEIARENK